MRPSGRVVSVGCVVALLVWDWGTADALRNPAAVYCQALGYEYVSSAGTSPAQCKLPDGRTVDAWKFLLGAEAVEFSYCARRGLQLRVVADSRRCIDLMTSQCAVCVDDRGETVRMTEMMRLDIREGKCGDGKCSLPENSRSCATDCQSGHWDGSCDGVRDNLCDPDCVSAGDPDCEEQPHRLPSVTPSP